MCVCPQELEDDGTVGASGITEEDFLVVMVVRPFLLVVWC